MNRRIKDFLTAVDRYKRYSLKDHVVIAYAIFITLSAVWLYLEKVEGDPAIADWLLVQNACKDKVIEARAESVFYGKASKLVFYCK